MKIRHFTLFLFLISISASLAQTGFAIKNVNVITMHDDEILTNQLVLVNEGVIQSISDYAENKIPTDFFEIDGSGKFLTPGWAEMHAHIPTPQDGDDSNVKETLFLYLANGITTIRGDALAIHTIYNSGEEVKKNTFPSPRIFTSSPSLNGNSVPTIAEAKRKVTQYQKDGYDFLKIHPGIKLNVFNELVKTADEVGIPFAGHVPQEVGIRLALKSKYASIDHLDGYIEGAAPKELRTQGGFFWSFIS